MDAHLAWVLTLNRPRKVDFSSRQSSKRPSVVEPEVEVVASEAPKTECLGLGVIFDLLLQVLVMEDELGWSDSDEF